MPQIINSNIASLNAQRNLDRSQSAQETALQRLSSGLRINSAKDDAAGIAIANRIDAQVRGLSVASRNAGDGVSLSQIAEGSIESISTSLQRLRELAVQSSNSTNGDSERVALNNEAQQLIEEIERTSSSASFNGVNLLDGTFQGKSFQVGANVGDEVNVSLGSVSTSTLGAAATAGISSNVDPAAITGTGTDALVAGDLVINGFSIGASTGDADTASIAFGSSSAIAKVAAINAATELTGVVATVNTNTVQGTIVADAAAAIAADSIDINGQVISVSKVATGNAFNDLGTTADAINQVSGATGVVATVVKTDGGARIDLSAADGRNITVGETTTATFGLATGLGASGAAATAQNTYTGDYSISSVDGSDVALSTTTGDIDNAGFEAGTFTGGVAAAVGDDVGAAALAAGDLTINGVGVGVSIAASDNASTLGAANNTTAISKAAAINDISAQTGVTATVNETVRIGTAITGTTAGAFSVTINDIVVAGTTTADASANQKVIVDAVNAKSGQTGVTASIVDSKLALTAADGRAIEVTAGTAGDTGLTTLNSLGSITLTAAGEFELGSNTAGTASSGFNVGKFGGSESGTLLKDVDISTAEGAKAAIAAVDNALNSVNAERAKLGSIQSRFENVISANAIAIENFSASASRIKDADFAAETAALSRSQVLQQAGISVLAQANARPQQVLSLLQ